MKILNDCNLTWALFPAFHCIFSPAEKAVEKDAIAIGSAIIVKKSNN